MHCHCNSVTVIRGVKPLSPFYHALNLPSGEGGIGEVLDSLKPAEQFTVSHTGGGGRDAFESISTPS